MYCTLEFQFHKSFMSQRNLFFSIVFFFFFKWSILKKSNWEKAHTEAQSGNGNITRAWKCVFPPQPAGWRWCAEEPGRWTRPAAVRSEPCPPAPWSPSAPRPSDSGCSGLCGTCRSFSAWKKNKNKDATAPQGQQGTIQSSNCSVALLPVKGKRTWTANACEESELS